MFFYFFLLEKVVLCAAMVSLIHSNNFPCKLKMTTRSSIEELVEEIKQGKNVDEILEENPLMYFRYQRTLKKIEDIVNQDRYRTEMTQGLWFYGDIDVSNHRAFDGFTDKTHYLWRNDGRWQDGYRGQETVIISYFNGQIPIRDLLQLVDWIPYWLKRRRRRSVPFMAKKVIITSIKPPELVYPKCDQHTKEQLQRRFTFVNNAQN